MAKDDYHRLVYQILEYLYSCLKSGEFPNVEAMDRFREHNGINAKYWQYILIHLVDEGYVEGVTKSRVINGSVWPDLIYSERYCISPKGITYLTENAAMVRIQGIAEKYMIPSILSFIQNYTY